MKSAEWIKEKYGASFYAEYCMWRGKGGFGVREALSRIREAYRKGWTPHCSF